MKNLNKFLSFKVLALFALSVLLLNSCKEPDNDDNPTPSTPAAYDGVFIINEGGFNKGNASIDFYNRADGKQTKGLFNNINNRPLGDIFQSMSKVGDNFYLVVNNSSKIEVVSAKDFKSVATISNLGSPRFLLSPSSSNGEKAYVTDLFGGVIHVLNLKSNTKTKSITLSGWSEEMVEANNSVYVNNSGNKKIFVIDPTSDAIKDSIELTATPNGIVKDKNNKIWLLLDTTGGQKGKLARVNTTTNTIEASVDVGDIGYSSDLTINGAGDKLYYTKADGLYEMDITATIAPASVKKAGNFYSIGIDPSTGTIYLGDALDFNQDGTITTIKTDGSENTFKAGINPGRFFFN
jgi:YVTN family beta-propeller protein